MNLSPQLYVPVTPKMSTPSLDVLFQKFCISGSCRLASVEPIRNIECHQPFTSRDVAPRIGNKGHDLVQRMHCACPRRVFGFSERTLTWCCTGIETVIDVLQCVGRRRGVLGESVLSILLSWCPANNPMATAAVKPTASRSLRLRIVITPCPG